MKAMRFIFPAFLCVFLLSVVPAAETGGELRRDMADASRRELLSLAGSEIPGEMLGEWKDILDSSLFMLFRKTELYRGPLRILVTNSKSVLVRLYPEGTFVISSALLDYIDNALFESAADSPRRMRNFDSEREAMLVPFLVPEVAHFALDHQFSAFSRSAGADVLASDASQAIAVQPVDDKNPASTSISVLSARIRPSETEVLEADRFSLVLLSLAGFDPETYTVWLESLEKIGKTPVQADSFLDYIASLPTTEMRLASIKTSRENIRKITGEFSSIIASLHTGTAFPEASSSLIALEEIYPSSIYISRLEALVLQRYWLTTVPPDECILKTNFPTADETDALRQSFISLAASAPPHAPAFQADRITPPGDAKLYAAALEAFARTVPAYTDPSFSSSFAMLAIWSGSKTDRMNALGTAGEAASLETGASSFVARANYAAILYLTGTDTARAQFMLEQIQAAEADTLRGTDADDTMIRTPAKKRGTVSAGIPGDARDVAVNLALMYRYSGDTARSAAVLETVKAVVMPAGDKSTISWRRLHIGDSADELLARWGQPTEIVYNYYTENWDYPSLAASVLVTPDSTGGGRRISLVRLGPRSPVSPGSDIRTGDKRSDFEAIFGKPAYRAADCYVYLFKGNRISVFYLADRIRSMTAGL